MKAGWKELAENVRAQKPEKRLGYILEVADLPQQTIRYGALVPKDY